METGESGTAFSDMCYVSRPVYSISRIHDNMNVFEVA
jgi:hypothetical protein